MRQASYPANALSSAGPVAFGPGVQGEYGIFFSFILDALHRSRRRQAQRILHQYRHLIARASESWFTI